MTALWGLTDEGDLLVFCATGVLHSIPLHALFLPEDTPVIRRNPVVYCASLTTFWQCWQRANANAHTNLPWTMVGVYENRLDHDFQQAEQDDVYKSLACLAQTHGADAVTGAAATREFMAGALQGSAVCHFHGHCRLDRAALADQGVEMSDGILSARDVFDLKMRSPHITLVACDSASQGIAPGDEPLGLVTALLCAGASSVIGTLWPTASRTGRTFAGGLYAELEAQRAGPTTSSGTGVREDGRMLNLAVATQRAVLKLRGDSKTRQPYHWASFVLHGSWFLNTTAAPSGD